VGGRGSHGGNVMIEFFAYLPPIQSAIMVDGTGDLLQVKLNIALKISPDAIRLVGMTGKRLRIMVEEVLDKQAENNNDLQEGTERKSRWQTSERPNLDQRPRGSGEEGQGILEGRGDFKQQSPGDDGLAGIDVGGDVPTTEQQVAGLGTDGLCVLAEVDLQPGGWPAEAGIGPNK
jgi:hypothetical protein